MTCWILLVSALGFLGFVFACLALFRIAPAALKVHVKVSPWSVSASVEMGGGGPDDGGIVKNVEAKSVDAGQ
jgi:hypothetical protein